VAASTFSDALFGYVLQFLTPRWRSMFNRHLSLPLFTLLLFSVQAAAQGHGGGRGTGTTSPSGNYGGSSSANGNSRSNIPEAVPMDSADKEGKIEFRSQTILVQVPVVVTDKYGSHMRGLKREDFRIFENGKEQKVSTFEEIVSTNAQFPVAAAKPGEFSNLTLSEQQPRTVTVIALDTVNTPFLDQYTGRRELVKYLAESLDSGQVLALMIITSHGLKIVQGLTGDSTKLLEVLKKVSGETPAMQNIGIDAQAEANAGDMSPISMSSFGSDPAAAMDAFIEHGDAIYSQFQQQNAIETTMNAFLGIAWSLSGVPGRKSLIWATGGFPFTISSPAAVPGGYLSTLYERTMEALTAAQISVYPVDVRGLVSTSPLGDARQSHANTGAALGRQISNRSWLQQNKIDTLNEFAEMTGGKAFYNTNDLASSFKRAADDASSYYLAGYYLDTHNDHAGWRKLKVEIDKKDTEVRARKGFFVTNATIHAEMTRNSDLNYALTSPIEGTGIPLTVTWLGSSGDGAKKIAQFLVRIPPNSVSIEGTGGQNHLNFDFAAAAYANNSKDGKPALTTGKTITAPLSDAQMETLRAKGGGFTNSLELSPGQYAVRVVIRDNLTGKVGSVTAPLTVN
jgi:VWFA-related protein